MDSSRGCGTTLRIAILVHGRFYAFDLARELLRLGHDVALYTNYPHLVVERFGFPARRTTSFLAHGICSRLLWRLCPCGLDGRVERLSNTAFARWAARQVARRDWDVVLGFSGASEETFRAFRGRSTLKVLQRASAHIRTQRELLAIEEQRAGCWVEKPSDWIVGREEREYALADAIHILSGFALDSFLAHGVPREKLYYLPLGVSTRAFRASPEAVAARRQRILASEPLRVLNVGTFSYQKGAADFAAVIGRLDPARFRFRFVGPIAPEARVLRGRLDGTAEFLGKRPQAALAREYEWGDVFVLPTIQDGFPVVLCQALAAGLPLITTPNCSGPELIQDGRTGWLVPVRDPEALAERLCWLDGHREALAEAAGQVSGAYLDIDWALTGRAADVTIHRALAARSSSGIV
jgi:glycosyltransferase involved in cell wall biosynthesis